MLGVAAVLAGCGTSTETPPGEPDAAGGPSWGGCREHSTQIIDYAAGAEGTTTRTAAIAPYRREGDHVVARAARPHRRAAWLLVDDRNVIHTSLELVHARGGWLVNVVEKCSGD
jgi:hypothetical protein